MEESLGQHYLSLSVLKTQKTVYEHSTCFKDSQDPCPKKILYFQSHLKIWGFPGSLVKNLPAGQETPVWYLGQEDSLEKEMATHSGILPGKSYGQKNLPD